MTSISNINGTPVREPIRSPPVKPASGTSSRNGEGKVEAGKELPPAAAVLPGAVETAQELEGAVRRVNDFVQNYQRQLSFSVHEETGITVVKVIDRATDEVIRQIPPEEVLAIAEQIQAMMAGRDEGAGGILVREKA